MKANRRLAACLVAALLLVVAVLALPRWPFGGREAVVEEGSEASERQARIEALRAEIKRELRRLQAVREQQEDTRRELRELEQSLERSRERIEQLRREIESDDGTPSEPEP